MQRCFLFLLLLCGSAAGAQRLQPPRVDSMGFSKSLQLPKDYYVKQLGYFCKTELGLQKFTGLNLFLRLGSKEHVDYLERKPNAKKP